MLEASSGNSQNDNLKVKHRKPNHEDTNGERFAKLTKSIAARGNVSNPAAVAASIGRKKYGAAKMAKMAAAGRKKG